MVQFAAGWQSSWLMQRLVQHAQLSMVVGLASNLIRVMAVAGAQAVMAEGGFVECHGTIMARLAMSQSQLQLVSQEWQVLQPVMPLAW
ncbi:hypothetical protein BC831DRAFT_457003 [Entophlyctis helioformis]|nr:hypothetical protein BC831DRAFT_457003 [Entophlyctis helioformis]